MPPKPERRGDLYAWPGKGSGHPIGLISFLLLFLLAGILWIASRFFGLLPSESGPAEDGTPGSLILDRAVLFFGMLVGGLLILDLLRRTRQASRLARCESRHRAVLEASVDPILTLGSDRRVRSASYAVKRVFGWSPPELIGMCILDLVSEESAALIGEATKVIHDGSVSFLPESRWEIEAIRKGGERFPAEITISGLDLGTNIGEEEVFTAIVRDMTEIVGAKQILEEERRRAEEESLAKSTFLANMSHEIRTPMTAIIGFAEILLEDQDHHPLSKTLVQVIRTIHWNGEHLLRIINDILDLSKIEAGKLEIDRSECCPGGILSQVFHFMKARAEKKGIEFSLSFDGKLPETIQTDPTRLKQILLNLVGNAIKFTRNGGVRMEVRLEGEGENSMLSIDVADTGIGFSEEQGAPLFQPFNQGDPSIAKIFGGSGLGLSISQKLARLLGGELLLVESRPEKGSRFRVRIPVKEDSRLVVPRVGDPADESPVPEAPVSLDCHVLLAEDGRSNQELISHILRKAGARVSIADNGEEALRLVKKAASGGKPFDLVLMDMKMPVMDGFDATRRLRSEGCELPVIALTAHAMVGDRERCLQAGCTDYATKPIQRRELLAMIRSYTSGSPEEEKSEGQKVETGGPERV